MDYKELNEIKKRGTDGFPVGYYYVDKNYYQYEMPLHWHKEFEIIRILRGSLTLFIDGLEYTLSQGDIITVNCGSLHRATPTDCVYECIVLDLDMLLCSCDTDQFFRPIINGDYSVYVLLNQNDSRLYRTASDIFGAVRSDDKYGKISVMSTLFAFFCELYKANAVTERRKLPRNSRVRTVSEIIDWVKDNIGETFSLDTLSKRAGLNPKYFCRVFKESTGKSPIDYINRLKIDHACLLISQGQSVTETAMQSGFSDMCYFSKVFKKHRGVSPSAWAKGLKAEKN